MLAVIVFAMVGTALETIDMVLAEGSGQTEFSQGQFASSLSSPASEDEDSAVISGLKFVCPFH